AIISHQHKFIFIKSRKTAGSSVEILLGGIAGPQDVMCPTSDGKQFGIVDQNNQKKIQDLTFNDLARFSSRILRDTLKSGRPDIKRSVNKCRRIIKSHHASAEELRKISGDDVWNTYYKFCFERNPFDRLVSLYHWRTKRLNTKPGFKEFAFSVIEKQKANQESSNRSSFWTNRPFYEINGQIVVDRVCMFEDLEQEMKDFFAMKGLPWKDELPHMKGGVRPKKHYREYYDEDLREKCEQAFAYEMEQFGYAF
ncbi:MAG: sulfotransferase family 2 domain-containing protein, partial [Bacteroidota bacterium]